MQIHNFYSDLAPAVRHPLDSIVLSPHTIKPNDFNLANMAEDSCDYQTLLPSTGRCNYYDQDTCRQTNAFSRWIWDRCYQIVRMVRKV